VNSIECLQSELDLVDIWRVKNPQTKSYTWSQKPPIILFIIYYSEGERELSDKRCVWD